MNEIRMNKEVYAKIPNKILSVKTGRVINGKNEFTNKGSYYELIKDDKLFKIVWELIIGNNYRMTTLTSIGRLIKYCGYRLSDDNIKSFKNLIYKMHDKEIITILDYKEKVDLKVNDVFEIDMEKIINDTEDGYTVIEQVELDLINSISANNKQRNTLFKCYLFIKLMVHKREDNSYKGLLFDCESQSVTMDYKYIFKYTNVADITKCIKLLSENNMIMYENFLIHKIDEPEKKHDASNTYVVQALQENWDLEQTKEELKIGVKQYKKRKEEKGFIVTKKYINNDKSVNGMKGKIKQIENKLNKDNN